MGQTNVIFSDATTAEAASILKSCGFLESSTGGLFTNPNLPVKVYVIWGKCAYYPDIFSRLDFAPRIQIHLKSREKGRELDDVTLGTVNGLRGNAPGTRIRVFDVEGGAEIPF
jgi:hypothetical protein